MPPILLATREPNYMKPSDVQISRILADPVSLRPSAEYQLEPYLDARVGGLSNKNDQEISHFVRAYAPRGAAETSYARRIKILPTPATESDSIILDIGCGPYDSISAIQGKHIFLDDIMDAYVDKLSATHDGLRVCARTELMPFSDRSIDVVYSINMIDHVDDMPETMAEVHRVLKPGGKVYMQTYYNSHPLLETEPGVFDRFFLDMYIRPYFDIEHLQTYAMGDPAISPSYTMDVLACVLSAKDRTISNRKPRERYLASDYLAPQSLISQAIRDFDAGRNGGARIEELEGDPCYDIHLFLLRAWKMLAEADFGGANNALKDMLKMERVRKNPYARIAVLTLENKRLALATKRSAQSS